MEQEEMTVVKTGTTTVALTTADGVVVAADRRASLGGRFVANKNAVKIDEIHPRAAVAISGSVGGGQEFVRQLRANTGLYESRRGEDMSIESLARVAGDLMRGKPGMMLLGGVETDGTARAFSVDGGGGVMEDEYVASGSGMTMATGALERNYREDLSMDEGVRVAAEAVDSASERDTASGNGLTIARITGEGVELSSYDDTDEVLQ